MMDNKKGMTYTFRWLKYQPDATTGEFVLMGYIALCLDTSAFAFYITPHTQRAEYFFAGAPAYFKSTLRHGLENIRKSLAARAQKKARWTDLKALSEEILPENENALQWTALEKGIYTDWSEAQDSLKRQIEQYAVPSLTYSDLSLEKITPQQLKRFAESLGWQSETPPSRLPVYVLSHPDFEHRQLVFPQDAQAPDYLEAASSCINKLMAFHGDHSHWYSTDTYLYGHVQSIRVADQKLFFFKTAEYGLVALKVTQELLNALQDRMLDQEIGIHVALKQNLKGEIKGQEVEFLALLDYAPDLDAFIADIERGKYTPQTESEQSS